MKRITILALICVFGVCLQPAHYGTGLRDACAEAPIIIKVATVTPEGSTWTNVLKDVDDELREKSNGRLRLKIYAGGVQGDEIDVIRKMRIGQVHSAGFTGVGLGEILPEVRLFDLPFFIKSYDELDFIRSKFTDRFTNGFADKGYVFLGWTEVGFVHFFSKVELQTIDDLRSVKMWMWEGDPLAEALFEAVGMSPIPLALTDVTTSLQTGLVDSFYVSPLGAVALQWFQRVQYILDLPMSNATGAILITRKQYDRIPPDLQQMLRDSFRSHLARLTGFLRRDNELSMQTMLGSGDIAYTTMNKEGINSLDDAGSAVRQKLAGDLYPAELLDSVTAALEEYRSK